jgi:transcriptional regulator CtsR
MNTDEIVDALSKDDNLGAETSFKSVMQQKVGDALELKRREVANNFVKTPQVEKDDEEV